MASTGDYAEEVSIQLQRQEYIIQKIIKREHDEKDDIFVEDVQHKHVEIYKEDFTDKN